MLKSIMKNKFAMGSEQKNEDKIYRIVKVIRRTPRPVYELEDQNGTLVEGQFYGEGLHPFASLNVPFIK